MRHKKTRQDFESSNIGEIVRVLWTDTTHVEEIKRKSIKRQKQMQFATYGVLVEETPSRVSVSCTEGLDRDNSDRDVVIISKRSIDRIDILETTGEVSV